jgi:hypothetical protein
MVFGGVMGVSRVTTISPHMTVGGQDDYVGFGSWCPVKLIAG